MPHPVRKEQILVTRWTPSFPLALAGGRGRFCAAVLSALLGVCPVGAVVWGQPMVAAAEPDTVESPGISEAVEETPPAETSGSSGEDTALVERYAAALVRRERLEGGNQLLAEQLQRLQEADADDALGRALVDELRRGDAETNRALVRLLEENARPVVGDLRSVAKRLDAQVDEARRTWVAVQTELGRRRLALTDMQARRRRSTQLASLLSIDKATFWLCGVVALAVLLAVIVHDRRNSWRSVCYGGWARRFGLSKVLATVLLGLVVLVGIVYLTGDRIYRGFLADEAVDSRGPVQEMTAETEALEAEAEPLLARREQLDKAVAAKLESLRKSPASAVPSTTELDGQAAAFRGAVVAIGERFHALESLARRLEADLTSLDDLDEQLRLESQHTAWHLRLRGWIRGGLGLFVLGFCLGGGWFYARRARKRRAALADTCPLCLGSGHFEPVRRGRSGGGSPEPELDLVHCKNVISRDPYEECGYTFLNTYRGLRKLCLPTLGVPQAGKTHWLAMLYWELCRGHYPDAVQFEKVKSQTAEQFDMIVEEILTSRIGTAATQRDRIPQPLVFHFRDHDRWGRSNVLVNVFDYSGEVTSDMGVDDYRRRRALEGDGFLFFLDPTYPSEPQAKALADFREDLRLVRGIKAGRRVRTPIALCVSKIDILAGEPFALPDGRDAITRFYDDLARVDPTGEALTLEVIEARSRLVAELRDTIWPGWEIERQIDDLFGGRSLFFPLTPVGLDGLGETDLSLRTISPFGLVEPVLWLLQMNGYPVLG